MNVLILQPGASALRYALLTSNPPDRPEPFTEGVESDFRGPAACRAALTRIHARIGAAACLDAIGICVPYGGMEFRAPVRVEPGVLERLDTLVSAAPLHIPALQELIRQAATILAGVPVVLMFDTAFFAGLPAREAQYALDVETARARGLRRYGYHGLLHAEACRLARQEHGRSRADAPAPRVISLCLEAQPELAAAIGDRPVYVTSGITPLEGLPGHTTCGDLDPGLVVLLCDELKWGPEQLNNVLTRESGLLGLTGKPITLTDLFAAPEEQYTLTRRLMLYRILQACGMALAAMGGVDALVFSGRHAAAGKKIAGWLRRQPGFKRALEGTPLAVHTLDVTAEQVAAEIALTLAARQP